MPTYVNQICPIESIAHSEWMSVFNKVLKTLTAPHFEPFDYLQNTLMDKLAHTQNINATQPNIRHWLRNILTQASFSRTGYSLRQIQRRIKHWTGQNHRDLQLYARTELTFQQLSQAPVKTLTDWSKLSLDSGFADQSHMGPQIRRVTGYSPHKLEQLIHSEEGFWLYRLLEQYHRERV